MGNAPTRARNAGEKTPKDAGQPDAPDAQNISSGENVDKIRDILFCSQIREYERRFSQLELRLTKEASDLREDILRKLESIESYARNEIEALNAAVRSERDERVEGHGR